MIGKSHRNKFDGAAALVQWNAYVDQLRSEYQKLKLMKV